MVVVGCCLVPSWPGVLDLDLPDLPDSAQQLHVAAKYIGDHVADLKPDIIGEDDDYLMILWWIILTITVVMIMVMRNLIFSRITYPEKSLQL